MAVATQESKRVGRPEKPIDWNVVEEALKGGCSGTEIAAWFNIHHDNFYRRVREQYGMDFTSFASMITPAGDMSIRMTQYRNALKGNTQLLMMLGEERLGQGRKRDVDVAEATINQFESFAKMLDDRQAKSDLSPVLNSSESNNSAETKS